MGGREVHLYLCVCVVRTCVLTVLYVYTLYRSVVSI